MSRDEEFDPADPPPDEAWWERALFQNEKLIDKYVDAMDSDDGWMTYADPRDLYNKVHHGIEPGEPLPPGVEDVWDDDDDDDSDEESFDDDDIESFDDAEVEVDEFDEPASSEEEELDAGDAADSSDPLDKWDSREMILGGELLSDEDLAEYRHTYETAFEFGLTVMNLDDLPEESNGLQLSACKVAVNLTGGHGLGYSDESLCGNIVKCRWALAECEFTLDGLQFLVERGRRDLAPLLEQGQLVRQLVETRIANLRQRVWW